MDISHPPQANEQVWAYSFISNDRKAIYMEANPWYFLRNRLTPGTVLVLPICNWPKKTTWLSPISILWRKRIWFQCNRLWSHIERYEESGKENAIYPTKYFSQLRNLRSIISDVLCFSIIKPEGCILELHHQFIYLFMHYSVKYTLFQCIILWVLTSASLYNIYHNQDAEQVWLLP